MNLLKKEISKKEDQLYRCAEEIERDSALNKEMEEWGVTTGDGIDDEI